MNENPNPAGADLPPYRAVLSVDVKNFSGVAPIDHHGLTEAVPTILERAFERAGRPDVWAERRFPDGRGDGFVVGFRPETLPLLVGPLLDALQDELAYHDRMRFARSGQPTRMRVSIAVGPLTDSDESRLGDGSGAAMVETHRLLDSEPVRALLETSDPGVTFVAAVISARVYEDVVLGGYGEKAPGEFVQVPVSVKTYRGDAYLHVPKPSGTLLVRGIGAPDGHGPDDPPPLSSAPEDAGYAANMVNGIVNGNAIQFRDQYVTDRSKTTQQHTSGDGNIVVGGNVDGDIKNRVRKNGKGNR